MDVSRRVLVCSGMACAAQALMTGHARGQVDGLTPVSDEDIVCSTDETVVQDELNIQDFAAARRTITLDTTPREFSITDYGTSMMPLRWRVRDGLTPDGDVVTLGCCFLTGSQQDRATVETAARGWLQGGIERLVQFDFTVPQERAHIRIFIGPGGNNSRIGRDARRVPRGKATLNLTNVRPGTIQHEFGHALGLLHEHLNPGFTVPLDERVIIEEMAQPPNRWSTATTRLNILNRFGSEARCVTDPQFNPDSIMMYTIPARWTRDGRAFERAQKIHQRDLACVKGLYSN